MESLDSSLRTLLNRFSAENGSNTPDFILANYLMACLAAFDAATNDRETWFGRGPQPVPDTPAISKEPGNES